MLNKLEMNIISAFDNQESYIRIGIVILLIVSDNL